MLENLTDRNQVALVHHTYQISGNFMIVKRQTRTKQNGFVPLVRVSFGFCQPITQWLCDRLVLIYLG
jgi:hypothetical protein